jgi:hypothetical protein
MTTNAARQELADLEAKILDGDTTVTAAALQKARAAVEFAELQHAADDRRAATQAAADRQATEQDHRTQVADQAAKLTTVQAAYTAAVDALRSLNHAVDAWQDNRHRLIRRGSELGLTDAADTLVDLTRRDWVSIANDEAHGRFDHGPRRKVFVGAATGAAFAQPHVLHDENARQRIQSANEAEQAERTQRLQRRQAEKTEERNRAQAARKATLAAFEQRDQT